MNRPIKFRAWDGRTMWKPDVSDDSDFYVSCDGLVKCTFDAGYAGGTTRSRKDWVLMQFTGLKDKNGKEIYEGDIVEWGKRCEEVKYLYSGFVPFALADFGNDIYPVEDCEVIGNVFQNPDLLSN